MLFGLSDLFRTLDKYNKDPDYLKFRQKHFRKNLNIATFIAVFLVLAFQLFELLLSIRTPEYMPVARILACTAFLVNLGIARITKKSLPVGIFAFTGFLLATIFASAQAVLCGGFSDPYRYTIIMILICWFIFVPLPYHTHIISGLIFIAFYFGTLFATDIIHYPYTTEAFLIFTVIGTLLMGILLSLSTNSSSAKIYYNQLALSNSEAKYRNLIENANDGIIITGDYRFLFANKTFQRMTEYPEQELMGKTIFDLIMPEYHDKVREIQERRMKGEQFSTIYSITGITRTGRQLPMELNSSTIDYNGKPCAFTIVRDFTEREKSQKELMEGEERYRTIFELVGDAILVMQGEAGNVVEVNDAACKLYGYTREEFFKLKNADLSAEPEESIKLMREKKGYVYIPNRLHKQKNGSILNVEVMGNVFKSKGQELMISVVHDLTEKKKLEKELERSYAVLEQNYSHTLKQMQTYFAELQAKKSELLRLQKENLQSQLETLKNQVNPHFLFNSLNILSSLISVNSELAEEFTGNLSKIYRYILEHKSDDLVTLASEMDFLQAYCFLLNTRFEGKLFFEITIPEEHLQRKVPQLAIQILIENAIKHNTFSVKSPLVVKIFTDTDLYLHIENNYQPRQRNIESTRTGLENISNRYSFFTDKETFFGITDNKFVARIPLL